MGRWVGGQRQGGAGVKGVQGKGSGGRIDWSRGARVDRRHLDRWWWRGGKVGRLESGCRLVVHLFGWNAIMVVVDNIWVLIITIPLNLTLFDV